MAVSVAGENDAVVLILPIQHIIDAVDVSRGTID
jgi:hypothetical protein